MSFLPDIASWALGGGAGRNNNNNNDENEGGRASNDDTVSGTQQQEAMTEDEIRAKRIARLAALSGTNSTVVNNSSSTGSNNAIMNDSDKTRDEKETSSCTPMEVDEDHDVNMNMNMNTNMNMSVDMNVDMEKSSMSSTDNNPTNVTKSTSNDITVSYSNINTSPTANNAMTHKTHDPTRKRQRKKELLLKKTLNIILTGGTLVDSTAITIDILGGEGGGESNHDDDDDDGDNNNNNNNNKLPIITSETIAEILASRLALSPSTSKQLLSAPLSDKSLISYLSICHKRTCEEIRNMHSTTTTTATTTSTSSTNTATDSQELLLLLQEIKRQTVSFAASSLMEPDLFEMAKDGPIQLAQCLLHSPLDPSTSITMGVSGKGTSFYDFLCEELYNLDQEVFRSVFRQVITHFTNCLSSCDTVLDNGSNSSSLDLASSSSPSHNHSGLVIVSALTSLCSNKKAAMVLTSMDNFLLPPIESPQATEMVTPNFVPPLPIPSSSSSSSTAQGLFRMMAAMSQRNQYLRRSGPALEKNTILGLVFRLGLPMDHSSVSSSFTNAARRTVSDVKKSTDGLRKQLKVYQDTVYMLIRTLLISAGEDSRKIVMTWFTDALLVNTGATALIPDKTKVSTPSTLQNISIILLKLCDPFMNNPSKIDPGFVSSLPHHGGVFSGITRLGGENPTLPDSFVYQPSNTFIPQCFFLCARSLHLSLTSGAASHTNIVRQVSHRAWMLRQRGTDVVQDPNFNHILTLQYANEVTLLSPDFIIDALRFLNLLAGLLNQISDSSLFQMPEHVVEDVCDIVVFVTRFAAKSMDNLDFGNIFRMVVKLLSPQYADAVRNYNLRAKLGDVLHDVFLPIEKDTRNSVPASVSCDPKFGGQPYLICDSSAQESLAPSLLLLYGEVEHTGYYEKMSHRANCIALLKFLWESNEHRPAFRKITQNKESFIKFANGIMNETNSLISSIMEKLPEIRRVQLQMANPQEWATLTEEQRETITRRHDDNEHEVKRALPLCNKTLQMLGFLNTDADIRQLFLLDEMCPRLVNMLLYVLSKLVGAKGMELKVDNPENYNFRPKEMLRDLCFIFVIFANHDEFQSYFPKSGHYNRELMDKTVRTCSKLNLLSPKDMESFASFPEKVESKLKVMEDDDAITSDAPDDFLDPLMCTFMKDPVILPTSGTVIDRATIRQHLLNDPHDPFNREPLSIDMVKPATELKERMAKWIMEKRSNNSSMSS